MTELRLPTADNPALVAMNRLARLRDVLATQPVLEPDRSSMASQFAFLRRLQASEPGLPERPPLPTLEEMMATVERRGRKRRRRR